MTANLTVAALLAEGAGQLRVSPAGTDPAATTADLDAQLLLAHVLAVPRARLKSHSEDLSDPARTQHYRHLLARRAAGEPLAYLTGRREFWSLSLEVTPAVLIPRPETELLVERALALRTATDGRVADLGTGCGAVALALASERPGWQVVATDACADALGIARANAAALRLGRVEFRQGDWYQPLRGERFDLLVSNPPYVAQDDPALMTPSLRHEPARALTPGLDALSCLRTLVRGAPRHLAPAGWLLLEHGATQGADVRRELVDAGFRHVRSHRDLAGHERMTEGQR
jgi:release factor glutamine methyltransferase